MSKKFIVTIFTLIIIAVAASVAIFFAKGYTFSPQEKRIVGTGILTISSFPDAASVYIDGHLTTATNTTITSLAPKAYDVRIVKEGYIPWEKKILIKEGLVTETKITLFPAIPTIYPLTFNGVRNPVLSPDGEKLAYIVPSDNNNSGTNARKRGVWVWTQTRNQPISFVRSSEPHQVAQSGTIDFSGAKLRWSSDSKQVLAETAGSSYLLDADKMNNEPRDITPVLAATLQTWAEDSRARETARVLAVKNKDLRKVASDSAIVRWSPDETKFIAGLNEKNLTVYDIEENKSYDLPDAEAYIWLPDSLHVILVEEETISIIEHDGTNKSVIYAGSFLDSFVFPWPDSSRLGIISSFPTPTASLPNLFGINLK